MKLIGIMGLNEDTEKIRKLFKKHGVHIFSETEITGHTLCALEKYGWWPSSDIPAYSRLHFAILPGERAGEILDDISGMADENETRDECAHPIRAFQVDVERMV
jgi:hypothetical protein